MSETLKPLPSESQKDIQDIRELPARPRYGVRRAVAAAALLGTGVAGFIGAGEAINNIKEQPVDVYYEDTQEDNISVVVKPGDTPWGIAREHFGHEVDIRPHVAKISEQLNNDGTPGTQPGDVVVLPPNDK
jgi:nucleoid-associated protein YgaU